MKANKISLILHGEIIENRIFIIKGTKVMIDRDLAELYGVSTKRLNEQVKRNIKRFPPDFMFQLKESERDELVANCDRFKSLKHSSVNPSAFTEQGIAMLSSVLNSEKAIEVNILIMRAFVKLRNLAFTYKEFSKRIDDLEKKHGKHSKKIKDIMAALNYLIRGAEDEKHKKEEIGFKAV